VYNSSDGEQALARTWRGIVTGTQPLAIIVEFDEMTRVVERSTEEIEETLCLTEQPGAMSGRF
jgi:hypothetical protein